MSVLERAAVPPAKFELWDIGSKSLLEVLGAIKLSNATFCIDLLTMFDNVCRKKCYREMREIGKRQKLHFVVIAHVNMKTGQMLIIRESVITIPIWYLKSTTVKLLESPKIDSTIR